MFLSKEKQISRLLDEGYRLLEEGEHERALRVSAKLDKLHNSGAYEIGARALKAMGREQEAIAMLEKGVRVAESVYILWSYLGHYYSDAGRYKEAIHAFEASRLRDQSPDRDRFAEYNVAIVVGRQGDFGDALQRFQTLPPGDRPAQHEIDSGSAYYLMKLGHYDEALAVIDTALSRVPQDENRCRADLYAKRARCWWHQGRAESEVLEEALTAIYLYRAGRDPYQLIREMRNRKSASARMYLLWLKGEWSDEMAQMVGSRRFATACWVVAESPEQGLAYMKAIEPEPSREHLRVAKVLSQGPAPDELLGVDVAGPYQSKMRTKP